jgi:hypothetical protein
VATRGTGLSSGNGARARVKIGVRVEASGVVSASRLPAASMATLAKAYSWPMLPS